MAKVIQIDKKCQPERPIALLKHEDPERYAALREETYREYHPNGYLETLLVEEIVRTLWRLQRAQRVLASVGELVESKQSETMRRYVLQAERSHKRSVRAAAAILKRANKMRASGQDPRQSKVVPFTRPSDPLADGEPSPEE